MAHDKKACNRRKYLKAKSEGRLRYQYDLEYRAKANAASRARYALLRQEFLREYGGRCVCCGESHWGLLEMDHGGTDGGKIRLHAGEVVPNRGTGEYSRLKVLGWPKDRGIRILCRNCNHATRGGRTCPHPNGVTGSKELFYQMAIPKRPKEPGSFVRQKPGPPIGYKQTEEMKANRRARGWNWDKRGRFARVPAPNPKS